MRPAAAERRPLLYLAGPEVFLPDARTVGEAKRAICRRHGIDGHFPLGEGGAEPSAAGIYADCLAAMRACDAVVANLSPFRSPSADPGAAFELGFMAALGRPVFGYSNVPGPLKARVTPDGLSVEDFGLFDNLMLAEALAATGGVVTPERTVAEPARDLAAFAVCVDRAARYLGLRPPAAESARPPLPRARA